jgi:RNA polymerase sigma-70 factor, ECF subfamily
MLPDEAKFSTFMSQALAGDTVAKEALFHLCYRDLRLHIAIRLRGSADDTDEVLQATFLAALESLESYRNEGSFLGWLKGIASHKIAHFIRDRVRNRAQAASLDELLLAPLEHLPDGVLDDLRSKLPHCLQRLSPSARALVERRWVACESIQDLAHRLGRTANNLSVMLHRIRGVLRACLEGGHG